MRFVSFQNGERPAVGVVVKADQVNDVADLVPDFAGYSLAELLGLGEPALARIQEALRTTSVSARSLSSLRLLAPIPKPGKIIGAARNYHDALAELGLPVPKQPLLFAKLANTVRGHGEPIPLAPGLNAVTYEGELAVVIGRRGRVIAPEQAMAYVGGYAVLNDVSATDVSKRDGNLLLGKNFDGFCPFGPILVTPDEVPDPYALDLRTVIDGMVVQDSNTSQLVYDITALITAISAVMTLDPGDVIATGTPAGTAAAHHPPQYLRPGVAVAVTIDGLGTLFNPVVRGRG